MFLSWLPSCMQNLNCGWRFSFSKLFDSWTDQFLAIQIKSLRKIRSATAEEEWVSNDLSAGIIYTLFCVCTSITLYSWTFLNGWKPLTCTSVKSQGSKWEKMFVKFLILSFWFKEVELLFILRWLLKFQVFFHCKIWLPIWASQTGLLTFAFIRDKTR